MTIIYADLSHYSYDRHGGVPDFAALKASGILAVCLRATYGDPQVFNPTTRAFREMAAAAKAVGLFVGGYHNLIHGDDASIARQVAYFKAELDAVDADWAMLDVEPYAALVANGLWPRLADAVRFEQAFDAADPNRRLAIYLARWFWQRPGSQAGLDAALLTALQGPLVNANYPRTTEVSPITLYTVAGGDAGPGWQPYGGKVPEVWQFSSRANLPGVSATEDVNAFRGSLDQFMARMRKEVTVADWYLNRALTNFRTTVNKRYPNRDEASDGTIGNAAHQATSSDHNPDKDGSVDAWDMDVELNGKGKPYAADVQKVIAAALKHESIQYVIYDRRITSRTWGLGTWRAYDGPSPHTEHVHFNTRESHEDSTAPWIIEQEEDIVATIEQLRQVVREEIAATLKLAGYIDGRMLALATGTDTVRDDLVGGGQPVWAVQAIKALTTAVAGLNAKVGTQLKAELDEIQKAVEAGGLDEAQVAEALAARLNGLTPDELALVAAAAREGAAGSSEDIVAGVLAGLPDDGDLTKADVAEALRAELANGLLVTPVQPAA